jgi:hypothetical protein
MTEGKIQFKTLVEAAAYAHVTGAAIYDAIRRGKLKAEKYDAKGRKQWMTTQESLDDYRKNKFNREKVTYNGQLLYDIAGDRWSVYHVAKVLSDITGKPYPVSCVYEELRSGEIKAIKCGKRWVIPREEIMKIYARWHLKQCQKWNKEENQMKFA